MSETIIELKQVSKKFDDKVVLDRVNLKVNINEITTIIGKSGVGKSVTLKLIMGLLEPDSGEILFNGKALDKMSKKERKNWRESISFMFQNNALFDSLTVYENIVMPIQEKRRLPEKEIKKRANNVIEALELKDSMFKYPSQLSGGMQKRVALARALIVIPKVVLFDEPTTGLDPMRKNNVLSMISHNQRNFNFTGILVSHDVPDIFYVSNKIAIIEESSFQFIGTPLELVNKPIETTRMFVESLDYLKDDILNILPINSLLEKLLKTTIYEKALSIYIKDINKLEKLSELEVFYIFRDLFDYIRSIIRDTKSRLYKIAKDIYLFYPIKNLEEKTKADVINYNIEPIRKMKECGSDVDINLFSLENIDKKTIKESIIKNIRGIASE
ncbi:MAG: ATP-binding cassette domain-containing protein [Deferribacterota bacterium]|nr:ATP-binding cassette domain-containing protein [Deferribacterota bacterium]